MSMMIDRSRLTFGVSYIRTNIHTDEVPNMDVFKTFCAELLGLDTSKYFVDYLDAVHTSPYSLKETYTEVKSVEGE